MLIDMMQVGSCSICEKWLVGYWVWCLLIYHLCWYWKVIYWSWSSCIHLLLHFFELELVMAINFWQYISIMPLNLGECQYSFVKSALCIGKWYYYVKTLLQKFSKAYWYLETKQKGALLSNKPNATCITVKHTMSVQSDYCGCIYCHCPVTSPWLSPTPRQRLLIKIMSN